MTSVPTNFVHRRYVLATAGVLLGVPLWAKAHQGAGILRPPQTLPSLRVSPVLGPPKRLDEMLARRITAVQLMFTGCSATCPLQGALFADLQSRLAGASAELQLLSISIDPLGDDTKALATWLQRFGAQPRRWTAALPALKDVDRLQDFFNGRAIGPDRHTPQVYLFDRSARLVFRSVDFPSTQEIERLMTELAASKR
jgi:protein SCO1/2